MLCLVTDSVCCYPVSWRSCTSGLNLPTMDMAFNQLWYLIEYQASKVDRPQSALQCPCAMSHYSYHLFHEALIRCDLPIPTIDQVLHNDCNDGVELQVYIVVARQRR